MKKVVFPENIERPDGTIINEGAGLSRCLALQAALTEEHNVMGEVYRDGEITEQQWLDYKANVYTPTRDAIIDKYAEMKAESYRRNFHKPNLREEVVDA